MATEVTIPDPAFANGRRWPRYRIDVPIRLIAIKGDTASIVQGRGNELNDGGMTIFAGIELGLDEQVAIEFTPPYSGQPIRVRGCIRNRAGYTYGVEFTLATDDDCQNVGLIRAILGGMGRRVQ
jgi:hypothetical protein